MALNLGTATAQDQLIVYLHSYLLGIGALYEPRRFNRTPGLHTDASTMLPNRIGTLARCCAQQPGGHIPPDQTRDATLQHLQPSVT